MPWLFRLHVAFMCLAAVLVISAVVKARKKTGNWFPMHRILALLGSLSGLVAFGCIAYLKFSHHYPHFKSPHAIVGGIGVLLLLVAPIFGMLTASGKETFRPLHRIFGRVAALFVTVALAMGALREFFE